MATLSKGSLFPETLVGDLISKVRGKSSVAKFSASKPIAFNGQKEFTFTMDNEIDVVAEGGKKSHGGVTVTPVTIVPIKVEYGARISDEFMYAAEEEQINILKAFNDGFAKKVARGLDLMAFHGINPRSGSASTVIGSNHFDSKVNQLASYSATDPEQGIVSAVKLIREAGGEVSGLAMGHTMASALADLKVNGVRQYPEIAWGSDPGQINGLAVDVNNTIYNATSKDQAILGDFANSFKWGYAKEIPLDIIEYGDPDGTGYDLKAYNQIYVRAEAYLGWGIMIPEDFARIVTPIDITISSAAADGTSGSTTSTKITITLSDNVVGLKRSDITLADGTGSGAGAAVAGALTGSGKNYELALESVTTQGNVSLSIANIGGFNFPTTATTVAVYKKST